MIKSLKNTRSLSLMTTSSTKNGTRKNDDGFRQRIDSILSENEAKSTKCFKRGIEDNVDFLKQRIVFNNNQILKHNKCRDEVLKEHIELHCQHEEIDHDRIHILPSQIPIIRQNIQKLRAELIATFNQTKQYEIERYGHMEKLIYLKDDIKNHEAKVNLLIKETNYLCNEVKSQKLSNKELVMKLSTTKKKSSFLKDIAKLIKSK